MYLQLFIIYYWLLYFYKKVFFFQRMVFLCKESIKYPSVHVTGAESSWTGYKCLVSPLMEGDSLVLCLAKVHIPTYPQLNVGVLFPYSHDYIFYWCCYCSHVDDLSDSDIFFSCHGCISSYFWPLMDGSWQRRSPISFIESVLDLLLHTFNDRITFRVDLWWSTSWLDQLWCLHVFPMFVSSFPSQSKNMHV